MMASSRVFAVRPARERSATTSRSDQPLANASSTTSASLGRTRIFARGRAGVRTRRRRLRLRRRRRRHRRRERRRGVERVLLKLALQPRHARRRRGDGPVGADREIRSRGALARDLSHPRRRERRRRAREPGDVDHSRRARCRGADVSLRRRREVDAETFDRERASRRAAVAVGRDRETRGVDARDAESRRRRRRPLAGEERRRRLANLRERVKRFTFARFIHVVIVIVVRATRPRRRRDHLRDDGVDRLHRARERPPRVDDRLAVAAAEERGAARRDRVHRASSSRRPRVPHDDARGLDVRVVLREDDDVFVRRVLVRGLMRRARVEGAQRDEVSALDAGEGRSEKKIDVAEPQRRRRGGGGGRRRRRRARARDVLLGSEYRRRRHRGLEHRRRGPSPRGFRGTAVVVVVDPLGVRGVEGEDELVRAPSRRQRRHRRLRRRRRDLKRVTVRKRRQRARQRRDRAGDAGANARGRGRREQFRARRGRGRRARLEVVL